MPRLAQGHRRREFSLSMAVKAAEKVAVGLPKHWFEGYLSGLYICAGLFFVVGSVCFLPACEACYREGVWLYFLGGLIYLKTAIFDLEEAYNVGAAFEVAMNWLYVAGTAFYLVATFLYAPLVAEDVVGEHRSELWGALGFIVGSVFFVFACFLNGAHAGDVFNDLEDDDDDVEDAPFKRSAVLFQAKVLVLATTNCTMLGALLFLVGSVFYLPIIGCSNETVLIGTWCYLVGSLLFTCAGVLPVIRRTYYNVETRKQRRSGGTTPALFSPPPPRRIGRPLVEDTRAKKKTSVLARQERKEKKSQDTTTTSSPVVVQVEDHREEKKKKRAFLSPGLDPRPPPLGLGTTSPGGRKQCGRSTRRRIPPSTGLNSFLKTSSSV